MTDREKRFKTSYLIKDPVFGNDRREYAHEEPYELLFTIMYDRYVKPFLTERTTLTIEHIPSGQKKKIQVNFLAVDEDDFSTLKVKNEEAFDQWLDSVEPGNYAEINGDSSPRM